ncbi:nucleotide-binding universal stress UspA family protein [Rhodococcus sp. 27YEA15]|uniref:universal stress protein n=1 Tax=Rhodococcus sp. 27YEA15 TaxID=3156259 RepID=UPI003C7C28CF
MRIVVGYLATPSGKDGLVLGAQLARSLGAQLDICLVLPPDRTLPVEVPTETGYDDILAARGHDWLVEAKESVPGDVKVEVHLSFHESFAQGLLDEVDRLRAQAIVVGAAGDGLLGRHSVGTVSTELLHSAHVPLALAPRGTRNSSATHIREVTCALGTRAGADVLLRTAVTAGELMDVPLRLVSLVALDPQNDLRSERDTAESARERARDHAKRTLEVARAALPEDFPIEIVIADGSSVESAVRTLDWQDGDLVMVGSSRLAQPRRLFLGSTAAKMLRVLPVPMVVVPKRDFTQPESSTPGQSEALS